MWQSSERAQQEHDEAVKAADIHRDRGNRGDNQASTIIAHCGPQAAR